jgi:hypothetical protein
MTTFLLGLLGRGLCHLFDFGDTLHVDHEATAAHIDQTFEIYYSARSASLGPGPSCGLGN